MSEGCFASCAQVQTATLIMYSHQVAFSARHSAAWADFVRQALEKRPHLRPSARALLDHAWIKCGFPLPPDQPCKPYIDQRWSPSGKANGECRSACRSACACRPHRAVTARRKIINRPAQELIPVVQPALGMASSFEG